MADVVNRTTNEYRRSVNTSDFDVADWIINPDLSSVVGVPNRYWVITGDVVSEMTQGQKDALDAATLSDSRDSTANHLNELEDVLRAFALAVLDELNAKTDKVNAILDAADNATSLADFKSRMGLISDYPQRTIGQMKTAVRNKLGS